MSHQPSPSMPTRVSVHAIEPHPVVAHLEAMAESTDLQTSTQNTPTLDEVQTVIAKYKRVVREFGNSGQQQQQQQGEMRIPVIPETFESERTTVDVLQYYDQMAHQVRRYTLAYTDFQFDSFVRRFAARFHMVGASHQPSVSNNFKDIATVGALALQAGRPDVLAHFAADIEHVCEMRAMAMDDWLDEEIAQLRASPLGQLILHGRQGGIQATPVDQDEEEQAEQDAGNADEHV
ncbi:uncharacterized protein B0I36DRAFT_355535 [Microdochium trichocladiopsis]|uniref:Uncharacterized protein n=1 Tax=Microdochium trichocladiopsis TaxID=1682393 RepID=A0A9P9BIF0_9PEZI|nr:uncharacterized protein B0I36DRAFT_355535 [Microdochium trichocladiopsis]KAH7014295.1 hypothetical protein B0I36DRAFT_355535 [Microdochium trichocladiopsis]